MIGSYQLDTVFHTAKFTGKITNHMVRYKAVDSGNGCHIVFHIMNAGQFDIRCGHDRPLTAAIPADNIFPPQEYSFFRLALPAKVNRAVSDTLSLCAGNVVIKVENRHITFLLVPENILLGGHILRHIFMHIQMVGRQIGDNSNMGAACHGHQLKAGQFQYGIVIGLHLPCLA